MPLSTEVRAYFGEELALYFSFLGHASFWLLGLGVAGGVIELVVFATRDTASPAVAAFALVVALWSVFFTEHWKRREATTHQLEWGHMAVPS